MNISVYLESPLIQKTQQYAKKMGTTRNAIIREALKAWLFQHETSAWPKSILNFKGIPDIIPFEKGRDDLLPPSEDPFA